MARGIRDSREYIPIFCHNCGINLNPLEDLETEDPDEPEANCGHCGQRHSIDKIKECRYLSRMSLDAVAKGVVPGLLSLRDRLQQ